MALFTLREKCTNTELILVCIFLYLVRIQENTDQKFLGVQSECGKIRARKTPYLDTFHAVVDIASKMLLWFVIR